MSLSKTVFYKAVEDKTCSMIFHPWNNNCACAHLEMLYSSIIGTNKFYNLYYLVELYMKRKQLSKDSIKLILKGLIQSTAFGVFMANIFLMGNCLLWKILGKFHYYSCFFSATCGGFGIFFENPKRRGIVIVTYINMVLELCVNQLKVWGVLTENHYIETVLFMSFSAMLMYYLRSNSSKHENKNSFVWFYTPPPFPYIRKDSEINNGKQSTNTCPHEGQCWKDILKSGLRYFGVGTGFQILRVVMKHSKKLLKSPMLARNYVFKLKNCTFGFFLACYLVTYKTISCTLCHYQTSDSLLHSIPAGFFAGLVYLLKPNINILLALTSNIVVILARFIRMGNQIPDWPYGELFVTLSNGLLYHYRIFHPHCCPAFLVRMINSCTSGKADVLYDGLMKAVVKYI